MVSNSEIKASVERVDKNLQVFCVKMEEAVEGIRVSSERTTELNQRLVEHLIEKDLRPNWFEANWKSLFAAGIGLSVLVAVGKWVFGW